MISFRAHVLSAMFVSLTAAAVAEETAKKSAASAPPSAQSAMAQKAMAHAATNASAKPMALPAHGIGIPGELLFNTPSLEATWQDFRGRLALFSLIDKRTDTPLLISQDAFAITFADGHVLRSSQMEAGSASVGKLRDAAAKGQQGGMDATVSLTDPDGRIRATWKAIGRAGADYLRQKITITADRDVKIADIQMIMIQLEGAKIAGSVDGCPVVTDTMFFGVEHPMATNEIIGSKVHCLLARPITMKAGQTFEISSVIGATTQGQMRRTFNAYIERERAHSYRTFLHYNSWYDIGYFSKYDEAAKPIRCFSGASCTKRKLLVHSPHQVRDQTIFRWK